ncbi:unnamed protein product [Meganyctiphanes norvegica]|uniref:Bestrophin homolog n=1 Tax=Meganyctiphanes norvegica TaxID=48144 RepID=A0AAV2R363_MEGNR
MTVSYSKDIVTSYGIGGCFLRLIFRWRASVYRLIYQEFLVYIIAWYVVSFIRRFALSVEQKQIFDMASLACERYANIFPLAWVLGFYVAIVYDRWWNQYCSIPWTTTLSLRVAAAIQGQSEVERLIRRTILRYANLTILLTFKKVSPEIEEVYPTLDSFIDQGLLSIEEKKILEKQALQIDEWMERDKKFTEKNDDNGVGARSEKISLEKDVSEELLNAKEKNMVDTKNVNPDYFLPMVWATKIVTKARADGQIGSDYSMNGIMDEIISIRSSCAILLRYDGICVPLVYTQVVTIAVYSFFLSTLVGRQFRQGDTDLYFPLFTTLQFILYVGWLKVAETILNPFGGDDDDFELHRISTYNRRVGYQIVDNDSTSEQPQMTRDKHWDIKSKDPGENHNYITT